MIMESEIIFEWIHFSLTLNDPPSEKLIITARSQLKRVQKKKQIFVICGNL